MMKNKFLAVLVFLSLSACSFGVDQIPPQAWEKADEMCLYAGGVRYATFSNGVIQDGKKHIEVSTRCNDNRLVIVDMAIPLVLK